MSEEIKPILNRLKMFSKYKKYIYPIEMDISECKILYDYINYLEKEIKKKDEGIKAFVDELIEYATRNEKAIEYMNNNVKFTKNVEGGAYFVGNITQLLKILKGSDNNENN